MIPTSCIEKVRLQLNRSGLRLYVTSRDKIGDCIAILGPLRQCDPASLDWIACHVSWTVLLMYGKSPHTQNQMGNTPFRLALEEVKTTLDCAIPGRCRCLKADGIVFCLLSSLLYMSYHRFQIEMASCRVCFWAQLVLSYEYRTHSSSWL